MAIQLRFTPVKWSELVLNLFVLLSVVIHFRFWKPVYPFRLNDTKSCVNLEWIIFCTHFLRFFFLLKQCKYTWNAQSIPKRHSNQTPVCLRLHLHWPKAKIFLWSLSLPNMNWKLSFRRTQSGRNFTFAHCKHYCWNFSGGGGQNPLQSKCTSCPKLNIQRERYEREKEK